MHGAETASLAPMVRLGTLPLRLLALERGATLVYSEEIVASKLAQASRTVDERLSTTSWILPTGEVVLSTSAAESGRLVVQLGAASAEAASQAVARLIDPADPGRDGIAGVDLNLGCAKRNTTEHGAGFALFADSARAEQVVRALRACVPAGLVLSCKVRLCDAGPKATAERCVALAAAGASRIAIHARRAREQARQPARWRELRPPARALAARGCEVLVNGDALDGAAAAALRRAAACGAVLVGRGALLAGTRIFGAAEADAGGGDAADRATLALCLRYAQLCCDVCAAGPRPAPDTSLHLLTPPYAPLHPPARPKPAPPPRFPPPSDGPAHVCGDARGEPLVPSSPRRAYA